MAHNQIQLLGSQEAKSHLADTDIAEDPGLSSCSTSVYWVILRESPSLM